MYNNLYFNYFTTILYYVFIHMFYLTLTNTHTQNIIPNTTFNLKQPSPFFEKKNPLKNKTSPRSHSKKIIENGISPQGSPWHPPSRSLGRPTGKDGIPRCPCDPGRTGPEKFPAPPRILNPPAAGRK